MGATVDDAVQGQHLGALAENMSACRELPVGRRQAVQKFAQIL